ncbi:MAG: transporter substrate-binding domain-containing protein, partial [Defluviitaleaceae bacterium]|nr:transporter substrate-binding domain-containing protein [Defluviitaleaceae bacterium]
MPAVKVAFSDDQSVITGRVLFEALKRFDYQMVYQVTGMRTAIADVNHGDAAILPLQTDGWDVLYENLVKVPVVIEHVEITVYSRDEGDNSYSEWDGLAGLKVGYRWQNEYVANNVHRAGAAELVSVNTIAELWEKLLSREVDAIILPRMAHYEHKYPRQTRKSGVIERLPCYTYVNNSYAHLVPLLESAYSGMIEDGSMESILTGQSKPSEKRIVLHLKSYGDQIEWERRQIEAIKSRIDPEIVYDYRNIEMNSLEFQSQASYNAIISSMIKTEYIAKHPDMVIASGNEALEFVVSNYFLLFPNVPVVFFGAHGFDESKLHGLEDYFAGVPDEVSFDETVAEMLRMYPDAKKIYLLNDHNHLKSLNLFEELSQKIEAGGYPVEFASNGELPLADVLDEIRELGSESLVLIGYYFSDSDNIFYAESELQRLVADAAHNPVFCLASSYVGSGAFGGLVNGTESHAAQIASMISNIFNGANPRDAAGALDSARLNRWYFDYGALKKYSVSSKTLPADHVIINRTLPVWQTNPLEFKLALTVAALLLFIICGLAAVLKLIARKQAAAEAASKAKTIFLANMSHEMRTPLNAITGMAKIGKLADETERMLYCFNKIEDASELLLGVINDILDMSRI